MTEEVGGGIWRGEKRAFTGGLSWAPQDCYGRDRRYLGENGGIGGTSGAVFRPFRGPHGSIDSGGRKEVGNGG